MIDNEGYRANVAIVLMNDNGKVFWAKRRGQDAWQFPQGGINEEESPEEAMFRELNEEVGLIATDVEIIARTEDWLRYDIPEHLIRQNSVPRCIGQKQIWFMLRLTSADNQLRLDTTELPEFDRWRWVDYWRPVKEVVYFKRRVYVSALAELAPLVFADDVPPQPQWWPSKWSLAPERSTQE